MAINIGRTEAAMLYNRTGGAVALGDVVVIDTANATSFVTTTTAAYIAGRVGVVIEPNGIADDALGLVAFAGYVAQVNLSASSAIGDLIKTHTVAGQGVSHAAPVTTGDFGQALTASATPSAVLFGSVISVIAGGGFYISPTGLTGATEASRYVGATTSGAPVSGTFAVGDYVISQAGAIYICTVAGTPGTWVNTSATVAGLSAITWDGSTTDDGQTMTSESSGTYTAMYCYLTTYRPIKLDSVLWDVAAAKTFTLKIYRGWQKTTVLADFGTQVTVGRTSAVTWDAGDLYLPAGQYILALTWTGAAKYDFNSSSAVRSTPVMNSFWMQERFENNSSFETDSAPVRLVAYLGTESLV